MEPLKADKLGKASVIYLSDAHLFFAGYGEARTRESLAHLEAACREHQVVVLNGDMFELPFSRLGFSKTVARAVSVLEYTLEQFPHTQLNYTIGNHDADPVFVHALKHLALRHPNFQVTEKHLLLEHCVSSHGDLPDEKTQTHKVPFYTFFKGITIPAQFTLNRLQGDIPKRIQEKGDKGVHRRIPLDAWAEQTAAYFAEQEPALYQQANHFVLGHTHRYGDYEHEGKLYSNTGVAFDAENYRPVIRAISRAAYDDYCARPKEEKPELEACHADTRACKSLGKIEKHRQHYASGLRVIEERPGNYVDQVMRISDLFEDRARTTGR